jgi:hypothetical protein
LVAKGIAVMQGRAEKGEIPPQLSHDLYVVSKAQAAHMGATEDLLIVQAFDALGEEHGRSEDGFKWALDIPGSADMTKVTDLKGVSMMHGKSSCLQSIFPLHNKVRSAAAFQSPGCRIRMQWNGYLR